jgi:hypothetical protein
MCLGGCVMGLGGCCNVSGWLDDECGMMSVGGCCNVFGWVL